MAAKKKEDPFKEYTPPPPCAHDGCGLSAYVNLHTKTGWAKLCSFHYDQHFAKAAKETCAKLGLETPAQMREWCRKNPLKLKRAPVTDYEKEIEEIPF